MGPHALGSPTRSASRPRRGEIARTVDAVTVVTGGDEEFEAAARDVDPVLQGSVRPQPGVLAEQALAEVRGYLQAHGGGVELVEVEPPVIRVRLSGACQGRSPSAATLRQVVEQCLVTRVPGIERVAVVADRTPTLIPLGAVGLRRTATPRPDPASAARGPAEPGCGQ